MNKDIEFAEQVNSLKLKTTARYIAYCLIELVKGFKILYPNPLVTSVYRPFPKITGIYKTESNISIVPASMYYNRCAYVDKLDLKKDLTHTGRILKDLVARLVEMGIMDKLAIYKTLVVNAGTGVGVSEYLLGHDYQEELGVVINDTPWFLFTTKTIALQ